MRASARTYLLRAHAGVSILGISRAQPEGGLNELGDETYWGHFFWIATGGDVGPGFAPLSNLEEVVMLKTVARTMNRTLRCSVLAWILSGFGFASQFELAVAGQIECIRDTPNILTCDHRVPHISTVPANRGELVELFVRERVKDSGKEPPKVVLMITGRSVPVLP